MSQPRFLRSVRKKCNYEDADDEAHEYCVNPNCMIRDNFMEYERENVTQSSSSTQSIVSERVSPPSPFQPEPIETNEPLRTSGRNYEPQAMEQSNTTRGRSTINSTKTPLLDAFFFDSKIAEAFAIRTKQGLYDSEGSRM